MRIVLRQIVLTIVLMRIVSKTNVVLGRKCPFPVALITGKAVSPIWIECGIVLSRLIGRSPGSGLRAYRSHKVGVTRFMRGWKRNQRSLPRGLGCTVGDVVARTKGLLRRCRRIISRPISCRRRCSKLAAGSGCCWSGCCWSRCCWSRCYWSRCYWSRGWLCRRTLRCGALNGIFGINFDRSVPTSLSGTEFHR